MNIKRYAGMQYASINPTILPKHAPFEKNPEAKVISGAATLSYYLVTSFVGWGGERAGVF